MLKQLVIQVDKASQKGVQSDQPQQLASVIWLPKLSPPIYQLISPHQQELEGIPVNMTDSSFQLQTTASDPTNFASLQLNLPYPSFLFPSLTTDSVTHMSHSPSFPLTLHDQSFEPKPKIHQIFTLIASTA